MAKMLKRFNSITLFCLALCAVALPGWAAVSTAIRVDQVGYLPTETKLGMIVSGAATGAFDVRRSSDNVSVLSGTLAGAFADTASSDSVRNADFSALNTVGTYYLDVAGVGTSYPFNIKPDAFTAAYTLSLRAFYGQRCGTAVNMGTVDGVAYSHALCHSSGAPNDLPAAYHSSTGKTGTKPSAKGWHDAGDYGKYIVNSGISTGELLWTYEWFAGKIAGISSNIPESGNGTPDILNEARWNLEWMLTMQDSDGGVWHKNTSAGFGSFTLPEADDAGTRYIIGTGSGAPYKTTCSSADFAAVMAIAARLYQPFDPTFAATCLAAAQNAWTWVVANPTVTYTQPAGIVTGGYGDGTTTDERLWAAAELFRTTGTATYNTYVVANTPGGTLFSGTGTQQDWANVRNLALWTYYFSGQASANAALLTRIQTDTLSAANTIATRTNGGTNGYKVSLGTGDYIWGSNGAVANFGVFLAAADKMVPTAAYLQAALNNVHYLLGRNTHGTSFVTHLGTKAYLHPHHRPSGAPSYVALAPWPGLLSGGPNSGSNDGSGLDALAASPPAKRWVDETASYAGNEIAINWNAPLVFLLAYTLPDPISPTATPTNTPSFTRTATSTQTLSFSATRTATPSATGTVSPTRTFTRTPTPSATATQTLTNTSTASPSFSATATSSSTATPSATATFSVSATRTSTVSSTQTGSPSATASSSATATVTATRTPTPSITSTFSITTTITPGNSPTFTVTPSATATASVTASATASSSSTVTLSITPTSTVSPTATASPTVSTTFSATSSITPGNSPTSTVTPSASASGTLSDSPTATGTPTATSTQTATATITPSSSASPTGSASATLTVTPSATTTITPGNSPTFTGTTTVASSSTAVAGGEPQIKLAQAAPQPQSGPLYTYAVLIEGGVADTIELKLYTRAYVLRGTYVAHGTFGPGWNYPIRFDIPDLSNGIYFTRLNAGVQGKLGKVGKAGKLFVLR